MSDEDSNLSEGQLVSREDLINLHIPQKIVEALQQAEFPGNFCPPSKHY